MSDDQEQVAPDDWNDSTPFRLAPLSSQEETRREEEARTRLEAAVRDGRLPKAPKDSWAATRTVDLIGRVLLATTYGTSGGIEEIEPACLADALTLLGKARQDVDRLEAELIMLARTQKLTWRFVGEALGLQSPQAAAQRWMRLTGNTQPSTATMT